MNKVQISLPLDDNKISYINSNYNSIIFVLENTKGLRIDDLKKINSNAIISITGGLNPKKDKFNSEHYQKRTYYSPSELISIISVFEKIERMINPTWNELEKCMFVYKKICEYSNYSENNYNGKDASRNLLGLITGKSVCSGYAIIFKEAMDRLGIKCLYQNRQSHHSWNIVSLDGEVHAIELTWDVSNKKNNTCGFNYFCRTTKEEFYGNSHHDISGEIEEKEYDVKKIDDDKLVKTLNKISMQKTFKQHTNNINGREEIIIGNNKIIISNNVPYIVGMPYNTFIRSDGSSFLILSTNNFKDNIREYVYLVYVPDKKGIMATKIYSEMDLLTGDHELRSKICESLLSRERINKKINRFNGYVGYVQKGSNLRYYNNIVEESVGIYR